VREGAIRKTSERRDAEAAWRFCRTVSRKKPSDAAVASAISAHQSDKICAETVAQRVHAIDPTVTVVRESIEIDSHIRVFNIAREQ
jgi:hypothetical protein